jgi:hypothetical protein
MLNAVALLPKDKLHNSNEAYKLFDRTLPKEEFRDDPARKDALNTLRADFDTFKKENGCTTVFIDFLGCWFVGHFLSLASISINLI